MSGEDPTVACQFLGGSSFEEFKSFTDIDQATDYFCYKFERPGIPHADQRRKNAHMFYEQYQGTFTGGTTSSTSAGVTSFTTYDLTDEQLTKIANLCQQEQGSPAGAAAEASLMANRFELYGSSYGTGAQGLYNYIRNCGWFAKAPKYMDNGPNSGSLSQEIKNAVKSVLVDGIRTLPGYVDEHDWIGDIASVTNDGVAIDKNKPEQYIQFKSQCHQSTSSFGQYASTWTYYCHPTNEAGSDPFGYTSEQKRQEIGDFHYDFGSGSAVGGVGAAEIPKAAKNINFPYSLIKNGYHEIIVNRYDMQRYHLNTKYKEYIEYKKKSVATVTKTIVKVKDPTTGNVISTRENTVVNSCAPNVEISQTPKNTRKNSSGNVDPMLEDLVSSSTTVTNKYFLHRAFTFDMVYTNEFDYQKYSDDDANSRRNADSESVTNRVPYNELTNGENKFTKSDIMGMDFAEIMSTYGSSSKIINSKTTRKVIESTGKIQETTTQIIDIDGKEYIENIGEEIYLSRSWADKLSQSSSDKNQVNYDEMIEYNENKDNKSNRSTVTKKEFEKSKDDEYKIYKQMSKDGELNLIDIMNSNPKMISTYLNDTAKQSEYMGYTKNDDLLVSYSQLKKLIKNTENDKGVVPYAYFISLGMEMGFSDYKVEETELSNSMNFGWPVDLNGNDGARQINCIYPYTPAYGEAHGAIDIAPGNGENIIIAAKDGIVKQVLIDNGSKEGYGNSVLIEHSDGYYTRYAHLESFYSGITVGTEVKKGDPLGIMGTTGNSTGVHLHFEILVGGTTSSNRVDPLDYYITEPQYGSISPSTITTLPSGYKFLSEKSSTSETGSTSTGIVNGKRNILIVAGHSTNPSDARGYAKSGYDETRETRKLAIALSNAINNAGMNAVIANRVLAGNQDAYDGDIIWGKYSLYSAAVKNGNSVYDQFKGYDHVIEIHFNASSNGSVHGALLVSNSASSITELDNKLLDVVVKHTYGNKKLGNVYRTDIKNINQLRNRGINFTYIETEFYDNKTAMDHISKNYQALADDMAKVLKEHFN